MGIGWVQVTPCAGSLCLQWALPPGAHAAIVKSRRSPSGPWTQHLPASPTAFTLAAPPVPTDVQVVFVPTGDFLFATATPLALMPRLRIGVDNGSNRAWINANTIGRQILAAGVKWDRLDLLDGSDLTHLHDCLAMGFGALPMYNPTDMAAKTPAQCASEVKTLATTLITLGIRELEFGNEPWWNGQSAQAYAVRYGAAHAALAGMGVTLIAAATGDWSPSNGVWSQDANNGGWIRDFARALPSPGVSQVDAWASHPYPAGSVVSAAGGEDGGWPALAHYRTIALSLGSAVPWYVTEVGLKISEAGLAGQATGFTQLLDSLVRADPAIPGTPFDYVAFCSWYSATDDSSGNWGLFNDDGTPRPSFQALSAWVAAHPGGQP